MKRLAALLLPGIVPTPRVMALLAGLAPLALLVAALAPGAWVLLPTLGLGLLGMVVVDGLIAGRLIDARLLAPVEAEIGAPLALTLLAEITGRAARIDAALALDPRLAPGGRLTAMLERQPDGTHAGTASLTPALRCAATLDTLHLRWTGPLGLGTRQAQRTLATAIRILPNLAPLRSPALQTYLRESSPGMIARRMRGEGTVFEALSDYTPGMERRRIDWKVSARHAHLYAREYEAERNNPIVFALDCGQAMSEPVGALPRLDRAITAALTAAWIALKGGDRVALFAFAHRVLLATPFLADTRDFHRLRSAAATLDYQTREPNFTLALATLAESLKRRSLIIIFSDFTDPTGAEMMVESVARLLARHRVLFVTLHDEELDTMATAAPDGLNTLATAVTAGALLRQRALVTSRLRAMGVDIIEAPHHAIGPRLIDAYLAIRGRGGIG